MNVGPVDNSRWINNIIDNIDRYRNCNFNWYNSNNDSCDSKWKNLKKKIPLIMLMTFFWVIGITANFALATTALVSAAIAAMVTMSIIATLSILMTICLDMFTRQEIIQFTTTALICIFSEILLYAFIDKPSDFVKISIIVFVLLLEGYITYEDDFPIKSHFTPNTSIHHHRFNSHSFNSNNSNSSNNINNNNDERRLPIGIAPHRY